MLKICDIFVQKVFNISFYYYNKIEKIIISMNILKYFIMIWLLYPTIFNR